MNHLNILTIPGSNIETYLNRVNKIPNLSLEEERELAYKYYNEGDLESAKKLILPHLKYVTYFTRSYDSPKLKKEDLIQAGNLGLMKAVKTFNPSLGIRLVSYAAKWIKAEIDELVLKTWKTVKIATTKAQRKLFFNFKSMKKHPGWSSTEETHRIANELGVTPKDVQEMESRLYSSDTYITEYRTQEDGSKKETVTPTYLKDPKSDFAQQYEEEEFKDFETNLLKKAFKKLDPRRRDILQQRYLSETKTSFESLAKYYGVSIERIRQLEETALKTLKTEIISFRDEKRI